MTFLPKNVRIKTFAVPILQRLSLFPPTACVTNMTNKIFLMLLQIGYNIFLSFLGNKKADDDVVKSALVPVEGGIERFAEDIKED